MYQFGHAWIHGNAGLAKNSQKGEFWLKKAAESGNPMAQCNLVGTYLSQNTPDPEALRLGARYLLGAAWQGHPLAVRFVEELRESDPRFYAVYLETNNRLQLESHPRYGPADVAPDPRQEALAANSLVSEDDVQDIGEPQTTPVASAGEDSGEDYDLSSLFGRDRPGR